MATPSPTKDPLAASELCEETLADQLVVYDIEEVPGAVYTRYGRTSRIGQGFAELAVGVTTGSVDPASADVTIAELCRDAPPTRLIAANLPDGAVGDCVDELSQLMTDDLFDYGDGTLAGDPPAGLVIVQARYGRAHRDIYEVGFFNAIVALNEAGIAAAFDAAAEAMTGPCTALVNGDPPTPSPSPATATSTPGRDALRVPGPVADR